MIDCIQEDLSGSMNIADHIGLYLCHLRLLKELHTGQDTVEWGTKLNFITEALLRRLPEGRGLVCLGAPGPEGACGTM